MLIFQNNFSLTHTVYFSHTHCIFQSQALYILVTHTHCIFQSQTLYILVTHCIFQSHTLYISVRHTVLVYYILFIWNILSHFCLRCGLQDIHKHHLLFSFNLIMFNILYVFIDVFSHWRWSLPIETCWTSKVLIVKCRLQQYVFVGNSL